MLKVKTSTLWTKEGDKLDITVKSGDQVFSPSWEMVMDYKNGKITEEQYTNLYLNRMRSSYIVNRKRWEELLNQESVTLTCFCPKGKFCHRYLLADILVKLGATYEGEV